MNQPDFQNTNPQQNPYNNFNQYGAPQNVPNSAGVLVLGIISIVFACCYGFIGVVLGIIAIVLAVQAERTYAENPQAYTLSSYKNLKAGKICAIVGLSLGAIILLFWIVYFVVVGTAAFGAFSRF